MIIAHDHDLGRVAGLPQPDRLAQAVDAEPVDAVLPGEACDLQQSVAVGVRLHDRRQQNRLSQPVAELIEIPAQRPAIDLDPVQHLFVRLCHRQSLHRQV